MVVEFVLESRIDGEVDHFAWICLQIDELFAVAAHGIGAVFVAIGEHGARSTATAWPRANVHDGFNDELPAPFVGRVALGKRSQTQPFKALGNARATNVAQRGQQIEAEGDQMSVVNATSSRNPFVTDDKRNVDDFLVQAGFLIPLVRAVSIAVI